METRDKQVIKQFLDELEKWLLKQEIIIDSIKEKARQRRYIEDLLTVLKYDKLEFVDVVYSSSEDKKQEFLDILKIVISNDREYHRIASELLNLHYLKEAGLIDSEEVRPQREVGERALDEVIDKCEFYLTTIEDKNDEERINELYHYVESLFDLASSMDEDRLVSEIKDYDFFLEVISELPLPESVKLDFVSYIFKKTNELRARREKNPHVNFYQELEDFYDKNEGKNTDELLDEIADASSSIVR